MSSNRKRRRSQTKLECPNCHEEQLARIARRGFLRNRIYPLIGLYPWQCAICGRHYLLRKRSTGYRRPAEASERGTQPSPHNDPIRTR